MYVRILPPSSTDETIQPPRIETINTPISTIIKIDYVIFTDMNRATHSMKKVFVLAAKNTSLFNRRPPFMGLIRIKILLQKLISLRDLFLKFGNYFLKLSLHSLHITPAIRGKFGVKAKP